MKKVLVRYKVHREKAEENKQLIQNVFHELKSKQPIGLQYSSYLLSDRVSFVHMATIFTENGKNPLTNIPAFKVFQEKLKERCAEPPEAIEMIEIGSYEL